MMIVLIEDSRTQAHQIRALLERDGFTVCLATNGEAGLEACHRGPPPDAVISDIIMPGIDGYEVCRRLKAHPATRATPVMLLTSLADPLDVVRALSAGADNYVTKPYSGERLLARLRRMIEARSMTPDEVIVEIQGERLRIDAQRSQILELLLSSLEEAALRNAELEASRAAIVRASEQRETLMGIVARELRSPLAALLVRAQVWERARDPGEALRTLSQTVEKQVTRLIRIIDDLHEIAQIEAGAMRVEYKPSDLAEVAREVIQRLRHTTTHELVARLPDKLPCLLDVTRIDQVVTNLISNAVKFSAPGSRVEIRVEATGLLARFCVTDRGIGIAADAVAHVFDRYFRSTGGKEKAHRLGLSLFVCKQLIELHGGSIGVESELGKGSTFWFSIPRGEELSEARPMSDD